jgi:hypothetical protein
MELVGEVERDEEGGRDSGQVMKTSSTLGTFSFSSRVLLEDFLVEVDELEGLEDLELVEELDEKRYRRSEPS